jgi:DNA polymerase sigma
LEKIAVKNSIEVFETAKVPIIKMRDIKSAIEVDISFGVCTGKENTKVIMDYCNKYPLVRPLALIVKYYLKQKFLNNSWSGGIGSYTLVIMIISYLQLHTKEGEEKSLVEHLFGFFRLYGDQFDYVNNVISLAHEGYKKKIDKNWKNESNPDLLSVEDPHNPDSDVGSFAFKIQSAKEAFSQAYTILSISTSSSDEEKAPSNCTISRGKRPDLTLSHLLWVNFSVHCYRQQIKELYRENADVQRAVVVCQVHPSRKFNNTSNNNNHKRSLHSSHVRRKNNNNHQHKSWNGNNSLSIDSDGSAIQSKESSNNTFRQKIVTSDFPALVPY